uniref:Double-stranded RNA-binding protein 1 n=1 Tax=Anthurium amnicola TaxID=1678845 RepID=A0A1D1XP04_9ARAE
MYKQKLQELCQQRQWALPLYTSAKDGPDHNPRFWASVTVRGATFDGPKDEPSRTSKDAQNAAARLAFLHFSPSSAPATPSPSPPLPQAAMAAQPSCSSIEVDDSPLRNAPLKDHDSDVMGFTTDAREVQYMYKSQLQSYAQKRNLNLPTYECIREGSLHALRFKAVVTVDGQTFESPQFFGTLKDAEHAAAKAALMSLSTAGDLEEEHGYYKNLLQELTQKEGLTLPSYGTISVGPSHMPTFFSVVEIEGERFEGSAAKTRKQAEVNAAKVAWTRLKERKLSRLPGGFSSRFHMVDVNDAFSSLPSMDSQLPKAFQLPVLGTKPDEEDNVVTDDEGAQATEHVGGSGKCNSTACGQKPNPLEKGQLSSLLSSDAVYARLRDPFLDEVVLSDDGMPSESSQSECLDSASSTHRSSVHPAGSGDGSLLCNRIRVYPRRPDCQWPPGTKLLPFSDEMWVAVSVEPSSEGSNLV